MDKRQRRGLRVQRRCSIPGLSDCGLQQDKQQDGDGEEERPSACSALESRRSPCRQDRDICLMSVDRFHGVFLRTSGRNDLALW